MPSYAIEVNGEGIMLKKLSDEELIDLYQNEELGRYEKERVISTMAERFIEETTGDDEMVKLY